MHTLTEVPLSFKAWYRVELPNAEATSETPRRSVSTDLDSEAARRDRHNSRSPPRRRLPKRSRCTSTTSRRILATSSCPKRSGHRPASPCLIATLPRASSSSRMRTGRSSAAASGLDRQGRRSWPTSADSRRRRRQSRARLKYWSRSSEAAVNAASDTSRARPEPPSLEPSIPEPYRVTARGLSSGATVMTVIAVHCTATAPKAPTRLAECNASRRHCSAPRCCASACWCGASRLPVPYVRDVPGPVSDALSSSAGNHSSRSARRRRRRTASCSC